MWKEIRMRKIYLLLPALLLLVSDIVTGLFITKVTVPPAAMVDGIAELICDFDLENDTLYSVKWYKGTREFFRYTPKEIPAIKVFKIDGINVDTKFSNESHLYLTSLKLSSSGRYKCEVSADAPSFHTMIKKKDLIVVDPAHQYPVTIQHEDAPYRIGDTLEANCTKISSPAANLTWLLNNQVIGQNNLIEYETTKNSKQLDVTVVGLEVVLQSHHFIEGLLSIRCIAELYDVFKEQAVLYIRESPQVLTSASGDQPSLSFMSDQGYRAISKGLSNIECKNNVNFLILICFVIFYVNYKKMFR